MLTFREPALLEHGRRVAALANALAVSQRFDGASIDLLERAALVHDVVKLVMPDAVLAKGGPLLPQERDLIRIGPAVGHQVMTGVQYLEEAATIVSSRYEWWDGSGYPRGVAGDAIPPESRVLAIADTFDTRIQPRRYRAAMAEEAALREIRRCRGTQFEPALVDALERLVEDERTPLAVALPRSVG
jgi:HD-GYP domain-containing protein (c-di-GMP phosphodiesterase class II)